MTKQLEELGTKANRAAQGLADQTAAFDAEHDAEVALLKQIVELAKPGLPAVCSKMVNSPLPTAKVTPDLYVNEDGSFAIHGSPFMLLTLEEVATTWDPSLIVAGLADLFEKQIAGRAPSTTQARERAAKLRAVLTLLG